MSPANLSGERARILLRPEASFALARALRAPEGAPLGEVFSFVSGLYFRGKLAYAQAFGRAPAPMTGALVISPAEGLRFAHEPVTTERLRTWADVDIDAHNRRFTEPLLSHARALEQALGTAARFVLLGSVASDKYVQPLLSVFGERLLFPPDFVGRGDMSRGGLLLRAAREGRELPYAPVLGAERHGPRPPRLTPTRQPGRARPTDIVPARPNPMAPEVVLLVGLPGAGKSTFFRQQFAATHVHVSKDSFRHHRRPEQRQRALLEEALAAGYSVVVDNTNASQAERTSPIEQARRHGARVVGYFFDTPTDECVARNAAREGRARIPVVGIFAAAKRLAPPAHAEGFDELYLVRPLPDGSFDVDDSALGDKT